MYVVDMFKITAASLCLGTLREPVLQARSVL